MSAAITPQDNAWLTKYLESCNPTFAKQGVEGISLSLDHGLKLTADMPEDGFKKAFEILSAVQKKNRSISTQVDRFIGQLILNYSATRDVPLDVAVDQLELPQITGKTTRTLTRLPRIVSILPEEAFLLPNLTTTHFEIVTAYGGPKDDVEKMGQFADERMEILRKVSANPDEWTSTKVRAAVKDLQGKFAIVNNRAKPLADLILKYVNTSALLMECDTDQLVELGVTRIEAEDHWRDLREQLLEKGYGEEKFDPETFLPPWGPQCTPPPPEQGQIIDAETSTNEQ